MRAKKRNEFLRETLNSMVSVLMRVTVMFASVAGHVKSHSETLNSMVSMLVRVTVLGEFVPLG